MKKFERNLNWLLVGNVRYAINRDNGSAMKNFEIVVFDTINEIKTPSYKKYTIEKIIDEIIIGLKFQSKNDSKLWLDLVERLKELL